jgi:hypothetical protein
MCGIGPSAIGSILQGATGSVSVPKIFQIFRRNKRRKLRRKYVPGSSDKAVGGGIIQFPQMRSELQDTEAYPDYEIISRWLKLADEMLGSADYSDGDAYEDGDDRKQA